MYESYQTILTTGIFGLLKMVMSSKFLQILSDSDRFRILQCSQGKLVALPCDLKIIIKKKERF